MAYVAVDEDKMEHIFEYPPFRKKDYWYFNGMDGVIELPKGSIEKLIGKKLTWEDEPVELKE